MGFSLRRALAGAVAGGAGAAVELADGAMKAAEIDRQKQIDFDRQKELLRIQDENAINRIEHVEKFKDKREADRAERFGTFLSETTKGLKADGVKPESAEGQARIAQALLEKGYPKEGNWFQDNSFKMMQLKSNDEYRKAEQQGRFEIARLGREARSGKDDNKVEERLLNFAASQGKRVMAKDRQGNEISMPDAVGHLQILVQEGIDAGRSPSEIRAIVTDGYLAMNSGISESKDNHVAGMLKGLGRVRLKAGFDKPSEQAPKQEATTTSTGATGSDATKKRVPGAGEGLFKSSSAPPSDASPSYEGWMSARKQLADVQSNADTMSPDAREIYLSTRVPALQDSIDFNSKYTG